MSVASVTVRRTGGSSFLKKERSDTSRTRRMYKLKTKLYILNDTLKVLWGMRILMKL